MRTATPVGDRPVPSLPLDSLVAFSFVLLVRDLWLAARGGGSTPPWMLATEITASGGALVAGLTARLIQSNRSGCSNDLAVQISVAAGSIAAVVHVARLANYVSGRSPGIRR
ncbi:MAG: hypothetical protein OEM84_11520 [Acidimicrobiia bacterium]|nr:hypothetical protein [Acidimicrobiia bacterium]